MKVPESISDQYDAALEKIQSLARASNALIKGRISEEWHFISRIKEKESFAQKVETGRVDNPQALEDFYACTIVVTDLNDVTRAEALIAEIFSVEYRRPKNANTAHLEPSSFEFDHVRVYVKWKTDDTLPMPIYDACIFEIQIKTYLQHAWSIATHALNYKTDEVTWRKSRIAFQVKAMLEHAEMTIGQAELLSTQPELRMGNKKIDQVQSLIKILKEEWAFDKSRLPSDLRRLAENVNCLISEVGLTAIELKAALEQEKASGRGSAIETLSPYGVVLQTLINRKETETLRFLLDRKRRCRCKAVISAEILLPATLDKEKCVNAVFIDKIF